MTFASIEPRTSDGKVINLMSLLSASAIPYFTGAGDNVAAGTRFNGTKFRAVAVQAETIVVESQFIEWAYVLGGRIGFTGADIGDELTVESFAPATVGILTPGVGNFNKVAVGPSRNIYVPATPGNWTVNLTEKLNANVAFTKVVPVPAYANNGYINWNEDTEAVTLANGTGGFNLFDFEIRITRFLNSIQLIGSGWEDFLTESSPPKKVLAQWKLRVSLTNSSAKTLKAVWRLYAPRKNTT